MKLAWFRARDTRAPLPLDPTAALITALTAEHDIDVITEAGAHDFVWKHFRGRYDLCVFELEDTAPHEFIWPYLMEYGGVALLHSLTFDTQRARLRYRMSPDRGARVLAVPYPGSVDALQDDYPAVPVRVAPLAVTPIAPITRPTGSGLLFGALASDRLDVVRAGIDAARTYGVESSLLAATSPEELIAAADVVISLGSGSEAERARIGMTAMASGRPLITLETATTADWPALDPHDWTPRPPAMHPPAAVTVDVRDETASVITAMTRVARDSGLRERLSQGGKAWGRRDADVETAVNTWRAVLEEAARLPDPARAEGASALADVTAQARRILAEFGVRSDVL